MQQNQSKAGKRRETKGLNLPMTNNAKRKMNNDLTLNGWNVRTLTGLGCNIMAIQETRWKGNSEFRSNIFSVIYEWWKKQ